MSRQQNINQPVVWQFGAATYRCHERYDLSIDCTHELKRFVAATTSVLQRLVVACVPAFIRGLYQKPCTHCCPSRRRSNKGPPGTLRISL